MPVLGLCSMLAPQVYGWPRWPEYTAAKLVYYNLVSCPKRLDEVGGRPFEICCNLQFSF